MSMRLPLLLIHLILTWSLLVREYSTGYFFKNEKERIVHFLIHVPLHYSTGYCQPKLDSFII